MRRWTRVIAGVLLGIGLGELIVLWLYPVDVFNRLLLAGIMILAGLILWGLAEGLL